MADTWRYNLSQDHQDYRLYSIGWNLFDDQGLPAERGSYEHGDYVWIR